MEGGGAPREHGAGTTREPRWAEKRLLQGRPGVRVHAGREARSIRFPKGKKLKSGPLEPRAGQRSVAGGEKPWVPDPHSALRPPRHSPGSWRPRPRRGRCSCRQARRRWPGTAGRARGAGCTHPRSGRAARRTAPAPAGARQAPGWPGSRCGAPRRAAVAAGQERAAAAHQAPRRGGAAWPTEWAQEREPELRCCGGCDRASSGCGGESCWAGPGASCSCRIRGSRGNGRRGLWAGQMGRGKRGRGSGRAGVERGVGTLPPQGVGASETERPSEAPRPEGCRQSRGCVQKNPWGAVVEARAWRGARRGSEEKRVEEVSAGAGRTSPGLQLRSSVASPTGGTGVGSGVGLATASSLPRPLAQNLRPQQGPALLHSPGVLLPLPQHVPQQHTQPTRATSEPPAPGQLQIGGAC